MARPTSHETMARQEGKAKSRDSPITLGLTPTLTQSDTNSPSLGLVTGRTDT